MDLSHPFRLEVPMLKNSIVHPPKTKDQERFLQKTFKEAHSLKRHGQCLCRGEERAQDLPIAFRQLYRSFVPARFPNTGHRHHPSCRFYHAREETSGRRGYSRDARRETKDVTYINLPVGRGIGDPNPIDEESTEGPKRNGATSARPYMTELGLLHELWERIGVNAYLGYLPSWTQLRNKAFEEAERIRWAGKHLASNLVFLVPGHPELGRKQEIKESHQVLAEAAEKGERVVLIAPLFRLVKPKQEGWSYLVDFSGLDIGEHKIRLQVRPAQKAMLEKRFPSAAELLSKGPSTYREIDEKAKVMAIALCEVDKAPSGPVKFYVKAHRISLMATSKELIPIDSSYELKLARALVDHRRIFRKPLCYDHGQDLVLPDFILLDTEEEEYPLEVFGMETAEYEARKEEKIRYYCQAFAGQWWSWMALREPLQEALQRLPGQN